jgi:hypothetical protein
VDNPKIEPGPQSEKIATNCLSYATMKPEMKVTGKGSFILYTKENDKIN